MIMMKILFYNFYFISALIFTQVKIPLWIVPWENCFVFIGFSQELPIYLWSDVIGQSQISIANSFLGAVPAQIFISLEHATYARY